MIPSLVTTLLLAGADPAHAIPREDALDNAAQYATHVWTMTSANTTASCDSDYESDYGPGTYTGLPYDWGGYMTLAEYDDQIAEGYGAGGHSWDGSLWCTAGVDCSGYISKVWDTGHYSTSTFYEVTTDISWDNIDRADAVNDAGSHVVLFTHIGEDGWPVFWESSGGASKVHINNTGGWSYVDGYQPVRFDDIEEGSSTGTVANPRVISTFPYTDYWWTPGAASDSFDAYNCAPDTDESGPEVLYRFTLASPGTLTVVVSDEDGVDIDVHVLTAPDADHCLDRDDTEVAVHLDAGEAWLSLDTYVGSHEDSGPYLLTATFVPDEGGGEDTAVDDTGGEDTGPVDTGEDIFDSADDGAPILRLPGAPTETSEVGGCGCASGGAGAGGELLLGVALALGLRRARRG